MDNRLRQDIDSILAGALAAADPGRLIEQALGTERPPVGAAVLAIGKAAPRMYEGFTSVAGSACASLMVVPEDVDGPAWALLADHPVPMHRNIAAAEHVVEFVLGQRNEGRGFVLLLSGGASALLTLPAPGLLLEDVQQVTRLLLASGAEIREINCVRRHIEQLKGGRLAALMSPAPVTALALSDVIGDDPASIGSGPVSPDPSTYGDAREIVERYALQAERVLEFLTRAERSSRTETPKPGDPIFADVRFRVIGNNAVAVKGARSAAAARGYRTIHIEEDVTGEAAASGRRLAQRALELRRTGSAPACIIFGGETTVTLGTAHGRGGRNQEMALAAAIELDRYAPADRREIAIATLATDGVDGPTDSAGAIVTGDTCVSARVLGLEPAERLQKHDSYTLFGAINALIRTGPTGTNVNDLAIALIQ